MHERRRAQAHGLVIVRAFPPHLLASGSIERVEPSGQVAKQEQLPAVGRRGDDGRANRAVGLKGPLQAARIGAQRIHHTAGAADEHLLPDHSRLRKGGDVAIEAECPFQLQARHLISGETSQRGRGKARVVAGRTPAIPQRSAANVDRDGVGRDRTRLPAVAYSRQACRENSPRPRARRGAADTRSSSSRRSRGCAECETRASPAACRRLACGHPQACRGTRHSGACRRLHRKHSGPTRSPSPRTRTP